MTLIGYLILASLAWAVLAAGTRVGPSRSQREALDKAFRERRR
jgi:hypothetical protein